MFELKHLFSANGPKYDMIKNAAPSVEVKLCEIMIFARRN
jgi:hypothetical protein